MQRQYAGTLRESDVGQRVLIKAWVHRRRDLGGLMFLDLRDRSGLVQAVVRPENQPQAHGVLDPVRSEWVVEVEGAVVRREQANPDLATGQIEIEVDRAAVLAPSATPPFVLKAHAEVTEELRLRHRYLDLRRPELARNFLLRDRVVQATRAYLSEHGFLELETPILTRSTPEGARDYLVPSREARGQFYALPQSPQLFKQLTMVAAFERYYQIARCFRDEDLRADRQPEFTQIDLELSFTGEDEIAELIEGLFAAVFPLAGIDLQIPFPRLTYEEAMARYGSDRPDLRFDLEIVDLTEILGGSGFRGFSTAVEGGGVVRGFAVPGRPGGAQASPKKNGPAGGSPAAASRKMVDAWAEIARRAGAQGVLTLRRRDGELQFQVKTALTPAELEATAGALDLEEGGLALLAAGPAPIVAKALGRLRLELAGSYDLIPEDRHAFLWVREFPFVERDEEAGRWTALHHPFTSPEARDLELLESDPGRVRSRAYDVVMDGVELGGGSIRIHQADLQRRAFEVLGIDEQEAEARFGFLLEALKYGAPPHGGIALGLDRIIMLMAGAASIRDVILFPKTTSASCLMTDAPSPVDEVQLAELGLRLTERDAEDDD